MGAEAFDAEGKIPLRQLYRTKIFKVFSLQFGEVCGCRFGYVVGALSIAASFDADVNHR